MEDPATETVRFAVDGTAYETGLNKKNAAAFRSQVARFAPAGVAKGSAARAPHQAV